MHYVVPAKTQAHADTGYQIPDETPNGLSSPALHKPIFGRATVDDTFIATH